MDRNFIAVKENGEARGKGLSSYLFGYIFRPIYGITLRRNIAQAYCVLPWLNELASSVSRGRVSKLRFQLNRIWKYWMKFDRFLYWIFREHWEHFFFHKSSIKFCWYIYKFIYANNFFFFTRNITLNRGIRSTL